jgi:hypothetical protein
MHTPLLPETRRARAVFFLKGITVLAQHVMRRRGTAAKMMCHEAAWYPGIHAVLRHFSPERVQRYLTSAKYFGTTLTGFFTAAKIRAFARWKKQRRESCRTISVQIHKSLRTTGEALREIQNKFSVFFVVTRDQDTEPPERLITVVKNQFARAQKNAVAENLTGILWLLRFASALWLLPYWVKLFFNKSKFGDSFQVSNVGRVFCDESGKTMITRLGDSEITACYCTSLPVPSMGNFTSLTTFRDSLFLSFNYCARAIDKADAETFVALFEQALEDLADAAQV